MVGIIAVPVIIVVYLAVCLLGSWKPVVCSVLGIGVCGGCVCVWLGKQLVCVL